MKDFSELQTNFNFKVICIHRNNWQRQCINNHTYNESSLQFCDVMKSGKYVMKLQ